MLQVLLYIIATRGALGNDFLQEHEKSEIALPGLDRNGFAWYTFQRKV
jgi:hypothetical protein